MSKIKRVREKQCSTCQQVAEVLFRIKTNKRQYWLLVCKTCQLQFKLDPSYQYGGTWKSKKRH